MWQGVGRTDSGTGERTGGRTDGKTDASPCTAVVFFLVAKDSYSYYVPLFGSVTLLCGTFLCIKLSEGTVQLTDHQIDTPSTILHLWYYQTSIVYISYWNVTWKKNFNLERKKKSRFVSNHGSKIVIQTSWVWCIVTALRGICWLLWPCWEARTRWDAIELPITLAIFTWSQRPQP